MDLIQIEVVMLTTIAIATINDFAQCLNKGSQCDVLALDFSS